MRNGRNDMGQMRNNGPQGGGGMKRRWDANGGSNDQGHQNKRPYQQNSHFGSTNGMNSGAGYQQKSFRSNGYENKPTGSSAPSYQQQSYGKFAAYAPMQMPPSLAQYSSPIASAVANYTFPPPQSSVMPPLPKN